MAWGDIAMMTFACVMANHMGLINAIERTMGVILPILNCPKCGSFWCTLIYCMLFNYDVIASVAISFLMAYVAVWFDLFLGYIDFVYERIYDWIYDTPVSIPVPPDGDGTGATTDGKGCAEDEMSEVRLSESDFE